MKLLRSKIHFHQLASCVSSVIIMVAKTLSLSIYGNEPAIISNHFQQFVSCAQFGTVCDRVFA